MFGFQQKWDIDSNGSVSCLNLRTGHNVEIGSMGSVSEALDWMIGDGTGELQERDVVMIDNRPFYVMLAIRENGTDYTCASNGAIN